MCETIRQLEQAVCIKLKWHVGVVSSDLEKLAESLANPHEDKINDVTLVAGLSLEQLREIYSVEQLQVIKRGNRLSILPVPEDTARDLLTRLGALH